MQTTFSPSTQNSDNASIADAPAELRAATSWARRSGVGVRCAPPVAVNPFQKSARPRENVDVLIIGGGLAGTSLAHHLESGGYEGRVAIIEPRRSFSGEGRWCTWGEVPEGMAHLISHRWHAWKVRDGDDEVAQCSDEQPYQHIYAPAFYRYFHQKFVTGDRIELFLGQSCVHVSPGDQGVEVMSRDTSGALTSWRAKQVFDARGLGHPRFELPTPAGEIAWRQSFVGLLVEFPNDVFDESAMTMMDFRVPQSDGVTFAYVLPFSSRRALVEVTAFGPAACAYPTLEAYLLEYLAAHLGTDYKTLSRESGDLPMSTARLSPVLGPNWGAIGLCGGASRAATGYAFGRIQRQCEWIAQMLIGGADPLAGHALDRLTLSPKFEAFDSIFLEALGRGPHFAAACFYRMIERVSVDSLTRFLEEKSTLQDEMQLIAALPKSEFLAAAVSRAQARAMRRKRSTHTELRELGEVLSAAEVLNAEDSAPLSAPGATR